MPIRVPSSRPWALPVMRDASSPRPHGASASCVISAMHRTAVTSARSARSAGTRANVPARRTSSNHSSVHARAARPVSSTERRPADHTRAVASARARRRPGRSTKGPRIRSTALTRPAAAPPSRRRRSSSARSIVTRSLAMGRPSNPARAWRSWRSSPSSLNVPEGRSPFRWSLSAARSQSLPRPGRSREVPGVTLRPGAVADHPSGSAPAPPLGRRGRAPPRRSRGRAPTGSSPTCARW